MYSTEMDRNYYALENYAYHTNRLPNFKWNGTVQYTYQTSILALISLVFNNITPLFL